MVPQGHRRVRRPDRGRPRRTRHDARGARLDPRGRRPLGGPRPARGRRLRPLRRHRRHARTARCTGPTSSCCARSARGPTAPVVASGGVSSLEDLRVLAGLVADGVEGAIVGKALYAGAFTLPEAALSTVATQGSGHDPAIFSGGPYEDVVGYARAVVAGPWVLVAGCTATVDGEVRRVGATRTTGPYGARHRAVRARQAGAGRTDVVRTRSTSGTSADAEGVGRAHAETFRGVGRPPRWSRCPASSTRGCSSRSRWTPTRSPRRARGGRGIT